MDWSENAATRNRRETPEYIGNYVNRRRVDANEAGSCTAQSVAEDYRGQVHPRALGEREIDERGAAGAGAALPSSVANCLDVINCGCLQVVSDGSIGRPRKLSSSDIPRPR